ncbi:zinc phosphodiesterase ELAC protein 1-like [Asterias amurensis]|uniref:zinc phosphodiesterase ELAC protein 1-like n=1 Tax=Asterias amurensis TaxID=7602 RepID=UPI003AB2F896
MDEATEAVPYYGSQFAELVKNPRSFYGYVASLEEAKDVIQLYEVNTSAKFRLYVQSKGFGLPLEECLKMQSHRIRFNDLAGHERRSVLPLTGVPFMILGKQLKRCKYGKDPRKRPPRLVKLRNRVSKKCGCNSMIVARDVLVFLDRTLHDNTDKTLKGNVSRDIKEELAKGVIRGVRRIYIDLPDPRSHNGHIPGQEKEPRKKKAKDEQGIERTGMDLTFLGTASCNPTPKRGVSSTVFRHEGSCWMFDCGEGTQTQLMKSQLKAGRITKIFITHLHGDHLFGLPGLLCTISQGIDETKKKTLEIYGPSGLRKYLRVSLELSRSLLNYKYVVHELLPPASDLPDDWETWQPDHEADDCTHPSETLGRLIDADEHGSWNVYEDKKVIVKAAPLTHRIPCFGYVIQEKQQPGKLQAAFLKMNGVPAGPLYGQLKAGKDIVLEDGKVISAADAVGPPIPGRKIVILGDTRDSSRIADLAMDADVLIHEATLNNELEERCIENGHSTPAMAASFATRINAKSLVLFHVSQRFKGLSETLEEGEQSVELLHKQATEANYSGTIAVAEDLDVISVRKKEVQK